MSRCRRDPAGSYSTVEIRPGHCPHLEPLHSAITHPHIEWRARIARVSCVGAAVPISFDRGSCCARRSILAMLVRNGAPDADKLYLELQRFIKEMPPFRGKSICRQAMTLVRPNIRSPAESSLRLGVQRHGIPDGRCNVVVPGITFRSGAAISLDIAWVEFKVGVEYDGDHHRTDKVQWRRDNEKKGTVAGPRLDINHRDRSKSD